MFNDMFTLNISNGETQYLLEYFSRKTNPIYQYIKEHKIKMDIERAGIIQKMERYAFCESTSRKRQYFFTFLFIENAPLDNDDLECAVRNIKAK